MNENATDFIGYKNKEVIIGIRKGFPTICLKRTGFPLTVFMAGILSNQLVSIFLGHAKNFKMLVLSGLIGTALIFAWSLSMPHKLNLFLWKLHNNQYINKVIYLGYTSSG